MEWFAIIGLVLILEGIGPLLFPNRWRQYLARLSQQPVGQLRQLGAVLVVIGCVCFFYLSH